MNVKKIIKIINSGLNSSSELEQLAKNINLKLKSISSMYDIPRLTNGAHMILIHPEGTYSGHWVALFITPLKAYYFDSFGIPAPDQIKERLAEYAYDHKIADLPLIWNKNQIQKRNETHCGGFAVLFLKHMSGRGHNYDKKLHSFFSDYNIRNNG